MKAKVIEIRWNDKQPIYSTDFHSLAPTEHRPTATAWRLATCGADNKIRLWLVYPADPRVEYLATLSQHQGVVNCVRFSPDGGALASAGDDGNILIWVPGQGTKSFGDAQQSAEDLAFEKESWRVKGMIRSLSGKEIYDLAWSPSGNRILAGSVDHTATIYDVASCSPVYRLAEHTNYVQGVAWDPRGGYIATQSSDRTMHVYSVDEAQNGVEVHPVGKNSRMQPPTFFPPQDANPSSSLLPSGVGLGIAAENNNPQQQRVESVKLYSDANSTHFFRRLAWSPDGALLLTPAGLWQDPSSSEPKPTVYIYSRNNIARPPIAHLPGHQTTSLGIRFCPVFWDRNNAPPPPRSLFDLPYRMVYAVATLDSVYLYDTQQAGPLAMFGNLHYAPFTDLTWSPDGQTLVVSSQDGYCSVIAFEPGELG
ncbi:WD40 repeat-like protein, partial [Rhodotorula sp. JG-1b]